MMNENEKKPDPLSEIFNLPTVEREKKVVTINSTTEDDFEFARQNLIDIIQTGKDSLMNLSDIADQSQHPRAFETLSLLMNTVIDAQEKLLKLRKVKHDLTGEGQPGPQTINNTLVISSSEMLDRIQAAKNYKKENDYD